MIEHNDAKNLQLFESGQFDCAICFDELPGSKCMKFLLCGHVYCLDCVAGFFNASIAEGKVKDIKCPDMSCDKHAQPHEIRRAVADDVYERYERLLLQQALDEMNDISYCPRPHCQVIQHPPAPSLATPSSYASPGCPASSFSSRQIPSRECPSLSLPTWVSSMVFSPLTPSAALLLQCVVATCVGCCHLAPCRGGSGQHARILRPLWLQLLHPLRKDVARGQPVRPS